MDQINFINKETNINFMTSITINSVVPQIGSHTIFETEGAYYEGIVDMVYHQYGSENMNIIFVVVKDVKQIKALPY